MKNQLFVHALLLALVLFIALITLSGTILLVATPLVVVLLGSWLLAPRRVRLEATRSLARERVNPDEPVEITVSVVNQGPALNEVVITDLVPPGLRVLSGGPSTATTLPEGGAVQFSYVIRGSRGSYRFRAVRVAVAGDLPLRAQRYEFECEQELIMLPNHRALARIPIAPRRTLVYAGTNPARQGGEGTEFFDIREHRGNEPIRHINWRASARTGDRLFVNEFQQERVADVAILLDCRLKVYPVPGGRGLFDAAASAAASLADVILDAGNRVGYLGYGLSIDWVSPGFGRTQKHRLLNRISRTEPGESHVFSRLDAIPERLFPPGSQVIVVSPLTADDPADIERLQAYGYAVMVVSPDPTPLQIPEELDQLTAAAARIVRLQRAVLIQRLRHAGVAVVDWNTSDSFEEAVGRSLGGILAAWRRRRR
ncbi:MAG: DUF58 domain-containing protein [Spirochaetota bacterium]